MECITTIPLRSTVIKILEKYEESQINLKKCGGSAVLKILKKCDDTQPLKYPVWLLQGVCA